jgi:cytochrome d ubiquinol oxidase subunit II
MVELWFGVLAVCITAYVVLDGFDLGAGALHLVVARSDAERRQVLAAIGPFWDGNEVWLLATGGVLFLAFPRVLALGLSGFYFAIFLVLWCLILRGISIEFRSHVGDRLWRAAWDAVLGTASALLPILFGAALGNLVRGLPIGADGWFALPLFTDFSTREPVGILDWYTVLVGTFALVALSAHGAAFLAWKAAGAVAERSRRLALPLFGVLAVLWPLVTWGTVRVNPAFYSSFTTRPPTWLCVALALGGLWTAFRALRRERFLAAFLGSCAFHVGLLGATAACLFPVLLTSTRGAEFSITAHAASSDHSALRVALGWAAVGFPLVITYFTVLFRLHRGPAVVAPEGEGY